MNKTRVSLGRYRLRRRSALSAARASCSTLPTTQLSVGCRVTLAVGGGSTEIRNGIADRYRRPQASCRRSARAFVSVARLPFRRVSSKKSQLGRCGSRGTEREERAEEDRRRGPHRNKIVSRLRRPGVIRQKALAR